MIGTFDKFLTLIFSCFKTLITNLEKLKQVDLKLSILLKYSLIS